MARAVSSSIWLALSRVSSESDLDELKKDLKEEEGAVVSTGGDVGDAIDPGAEAAVRSGKLSDSATAEEKDLFATVSIDCSLRNEDGARWRLEE